MNVIYFTEIIILIIYEHIKIKINLFETISETEVSNNKIKN